MSNPILDFQDKHGAEWAKLVSSPLWVDLKFTLLMLGPAENLKAVDADSVSRNGSVYAGNVQGYSECINIMENVLPIPEDSDPDNSSKEADYSEEV